MNDCYKPFKLKLNKITVFIQPYGWSKRMAEKLYKERLKSKGIKVRKGREK